MCLLFPITFLFFIHPCFVVRWFLLSNNVLYYFVCYTLYQHFSIFVLLKNDVMNVGGDKKLKFLTCEKEIVVKMETFECHSFLLLGKSKYVEASPHINCQPRLPKLTFEVCNIHILGWNTWKVFLGQTNGFIL